MQAFPSIFPRTLAAVLIAVVAGGCSSNTTKLERAQRDFEAGRYDNARIEYLNVLQADPQNATAIQQLGIIWFGEGAPLRALPYLLRAREIAPDHLDARTKLGMVFLSLGQVLEARK